MYPSKSFVTDQALNLDGLSSTTLNKIEMSLVNIAYRQAVYGIIVSLFCSTVLLLGLHHIASSDTLFYWYAFCLIVSTLRVFLYHYYKKQEFPEQNLSLWRRLFIVGAFLGGFTWGLAGSVLFPFHHSLQQTLIILIIAGTSAGAVPNLAPIRSAAIAFLMASQVPLVINLLFFNQELTYFFVVTLLAYMFYMLMLSGSLHRTIKNSVCLGYENDTLLISLTKTKKQLQFINKQLEQAATHDPLTHVANRNLFIDNFSNAIIAAEQDKEVLSLLYLDLDHFKSVNDYHGHHIGDQLLLSVVGVLENICRSNSVIYRIGGDEFTIIIENVKSITDVEKLARDICEALSKPITIGTIEVNVGCSIGISLYPIDSTDPEELLEIADKAMYQVKKQGGNNYQFKVEMIMNEGKE